VLGDHVRFTDSGAEGAPAENAAVSVEDAAVLAAVEAVEAIETALAALCDVGAVHEMTAGEFAASLEMVRVPLDPVWGAYQAGTARDCPGEITAPAYSAENVRVGPVQVTLDIVTGLFPELVSMKVCAE
jgi:hypothetical protein